MQSHNLVLTIEKGIDTAENKHQINAILTYLSLVPEKRVTG